MSRDPWQLGWPGSCLGEALETLGRHAGLGVGEAGEVTPPADLLIEGGERLDRWVEATADWLGLEAQPVEIPYAALERLIGGSGPGCFVSRGRPRRGSSPCSEGPGATSGS